MLGASRPVSAQGSPCGSPLGKTPPPQAPRTAPPPPPTVVSLGGLAGGAHLNPLLDLDRASAPLRKPFRSKSELTTAPLASHARAHHGAVLSFSPQVRSGVSPSSSPPSCRHGAPPQCRRCTQADMHCQSRRVSLVSRARPGRPGQLSGGARAKDEALASVCQWRDSLHLDVSMRSTFPGSGAVWGVAASTCKLWDVSRVRTCACSM